MILSEILILFNGSKARKCEKLGSDEHYAHLYPWWNNNDVGVFHDLVSNLAKIEYQIGEVLIQLQQEFLDNLKN